MKRNLLAIALLAGLVSLLITSCGGKKKQSNESNEAVEIASIEASDMLTVDTAASYIEWVGSKPGTDHTGKVYIESGEIGINKEADELVSGKFVIDMKTVNNEDLDGKMKQMLEDHLKSEDFFDVEKYPTSSFEISSAIKEDENGTYKITGNLTMKDVTLSIEFSATISESEGTYTADSETIVLDRTQWGVNYGSKNIFKELKDNIISDQMSITLHIVAK